MPDGVCANMKSDCDDLVSLYTAGASLRSSCMPKGLGTAHRAVSMCFSAVSKPCRARPVWIVSTARMSALVLVLVSRPPLSMPSTNLVKCFQSDMCHAACAASALISCRWMLSAAAHSSRQSFSRLSQSADDARQRMTPMLASQCAWLPRRAPASALRYCPSAVSYMRSFSYHFAPIFCSASGATFIVWLRMPCAASGRRSWLQMWMRDSAAVSGDVWYSSSL